eukprot:1693818-Lingulodinium_polyedra.AAC.1
MPSADGRTCVAAWAARAPEVAARPVGPSPRPAGPPPVGCHDLARDGGLLSCVVCGRTAQRNRWT